MASWSIVRFFRCSALLCWLLTTSLSPLAQERANQPQTSEGAIELTITTDLVPPHTVTQPISINLRAISQISVANARIIIVAGGTISVEQAAASFEAGEVREAYFANLPVNSRLQSDIGSLNIGEIRSETILIRASGVGQGYLAITVSTGSSSDVTRSANSIVVYAVSTGQQVFFSDQSFLDAEIRQLRAQQAEPGLTQEDLARRIQQLRRSGARSTIETERRLFTLRPEEFRETATTAVISGRVMFTDRAGRTHPVRDNQIQILEEHGATETVVADSRTDDQGHYSVAVSIPAGGSKNLFVLAIAANNMVRVIEHQSTETWGVSSPVSRGVRAGARLTVNITAVNDQSKINNLAFEVYEAINYGARYVRSLTGAPPNLVTVSFPKAGDDGSFYQNGLLTLAGTDAHDWDNILHEYGHHVQALFKLANSPGGAHAGENLCRAPGRNRDTGTRLAWGEAWPTFFAIALQSELNLRNLGVPDVGDTRYTDTKPDGSRFEYDLEQASNADVGEGNENAIQRVLWDFFDNSADQGEPVTLSGAQLWAAMIAAKPTRFSEFWTPFMAGRSGRAVGDFGGILAAHGIASKPTSPPDGAVLPSNVAHEFVWETANQCADSGKGQYSLRFYSANYLTTLFSSPFASATRVNVSAPDLQRVARATGGRLIWAVVARDASVPVTADYQGPFSEARIQQVSAEPELMAVAPTSEPARSLRPNPSTQDTFAEFCRSRLTDVAEDHQVCVLGIVVDSTRVRIVRSTAAEPADTGHVVDVYESPLGQLSPTSLSDLRGAAGQVVVFGGAAVGGRIFSARRL